MKNNQKTIESFLDSVMQALKCKKKGESWYLEGKEAILVLNLQKSQWGEQFYINIGIFLKKLGNIKYPKEYQCHIRSRLSELVDDKKELINRLNFEAYRETETEKLNFIAEQIKQYAVPFFSHLNSLKELRTILNKQRANSVMLTLDAKNELDL